MSWTGRGSLAGQRPGGCTRGGLPDSARPAAADPGHICEHRRALLREQGMWGAAWAPDVWLWAASWVLWI